MCREDKGTKTKRNISTKLSNDENDNFANTHNADCDDVDVLP